VWRFIAVLAGFEGACHHGVPDTGPGCAPVLELHRSGSGVFEVADELAEDPRLVGVGDASVDLLHHRLGEDLGPLPAVPLDRTGHL